MRGLSSNREEFTTLPEFHVGSQEWNYRVEGHEPGGKWLAIVFSFKTVDTTFLITVFSVESKKK